MPFEDVIKPRFGFAFLVHDAGSANVLYGSSAGLDVSAVQEWTQETPGVEDTAEVDDHFGGALY